MSFQVRTRIKGTRIYADAPGFTTGAAWAPGTASYEAAGQKNRAIRMRWNNGGPNAALTGSLDTLRGKSRDLVRNNGSANNGIEALVTALIGTGIKPKFMTDDAGLNKDLTALWLDWTDESDADNRLDFYGQQALAFRSMCEGGDVFARLRARRPQDAMATVPLQIQLLESEMCPVERNEARANGGWIENGVEFDNIGRRTAYWLYKQHPGDRNLGSINSFNIPGAIPAQDVIHMAAVQRPGRIRGEPWLARAIVRLYDVDKYDDAMLLRQQVANMYAGFVTPAAEGLMPTDMLTTAEARGEVYLEPGLMQILEPGETINFSSPPQAGSEYATYMRKQERTIAASIGVLYEQLTGDYSQGNDRTWRAAVGEFRRAITRHQHQLMVFQFCRPILARWLGLGMLAGVIKLPKGIEDRDVLRVDWTPPTFDYINPLQDVQTRIAEVRAGFKSRKQIVNEDGDDIERLDEEIAEDHAREDELGLVFQTDPSQVSNTGLEQPSAVATDPNAPPKPDEPPGPPA
jgi:lambda family phage portal protein